MPYRQEIARRSSAAVMAAAVGALPALLPARAAAQDLRYSITPTAQQVSWDNALGLDNTLLYGGRLGVVFGRRIELQGFYLTNRGTDGGVRDLYDRLNVSERPPENPGLGVQNYGAAVVYNFALGGFTPFVRGGGSVLRFDPAGGQRSDRIALGYGGGLRFGKPGGLRFNVFAEDLRFRVDRRLLLALPAGATPPADVDADKFRSNLTYGAGLSVPIGGGAVTYDDTPQYQLGNVALPVEAFAARHDFANASGIPRQNVLGVRTGIDFGPLVGLRAFYWRGVNDDFRRTQGVQGYGGEAQFALNAGPGVNPFLIAGAGQIDFTDRYAASTTAGAPVPPPADQTALILGGGVKIPVGTRFQLTGAARNYLSAADRRTQDVAEASQLRSNWQFSVGMSFGVGGRGARRQVAAAPRRDTVFVERASGRLVREADVAAADESAPATERVVVTERLAVTARGDTLRGAAADSALAADRTTRAVEVRSVAPAGRAGSYASDRTVQIVVPTEGEIIVRYGPQRGAAGAAPAGSPAAAPRTLVRELRERDGRVVREYREGDGTLSREFVDDRGRPVREYREPSGRVVREYIVVPSAGGGTTFVPGAAASPTVTVIPPSAPAYQQPSSPTAPAPPRYVPGYEPSGYAGSGYVGGATGASAGEVLPPEPVTGDGDTVVKERRNAVVSRTRPRTAREIAVDDRITARVDSLERAVAARDAGGRALGVNPEDVRAIVREELARADRERATMPGAGATTVVTQPTAPGVQVVRGTQPVFYDNGSGVQGGLLYSGATLNDARQALVGVRLDFGSVAPTVRGIRLIPEIALGVGGGATSTYVAANALYELGPIFRVRPRVSLGGGLLNFSNPVGSREGLDVVVTPAYGVSLPFSGLRNFGLARTPELLVEHQGVGLFKLNRVVVGLGWRR